MSGGVLLPFNVIQPFDLRFIADDLHVMAFFEGHTEYEAVEAMIRRADAAPPIIRAIITRHDQTQVDHVNDDALLRAAQFSGRQTCLRQISLNEERAGDNKRAVLEFESFRGERIVLDVTSAGPPQASRGGLTDPGDHSIGTALPVMFRGKSAYAGPGTGVSIDGVGFTVPVKMRLGADFVALNGSFTESHHMGILRAGSVANEIVEVPARFDPGERWVMRGAQGERVHTIEGRSNGELEVVHSNAAARETVRCRIVDGRVCLQQVRVGSAADPAQYVSLSFDANAVFSIGIDGVDRVICGSYAVEGTGAGACVHLRPETPAWAQSRRARLDIECVGSRLLVVTRIVGAQNAAQP